MPPAIPTTTGQSCCPTPAGAEKLWRDDHAYDVVAVLGYNDQPVVPDCGSAIFLHVAAPDYAPTQGCIAMARDDLVAMLRDCDPETRLCVFRLTEAARVILAPDARRR